MRTWLRRNRWGLVALPLTAVLAFAGNAQRLQDYWWDRELRHAASAGDANTWVTWSGPFTDAAGTGTRTLRVRVTGAEPTGVAGLPPDVVGWRVSMDLEAAPDQVITGCRLALADDAGNRYVYQSAVGPLSQAISPCLPDDRPGPAPSLVAGKPRVTLPGEERPSHWSTRPVIVAPQGAHITQALLWWEEPDYLAVRLN